MSTKSKSIGESLFPKTKRELLALFFINPEKSFYLREIVSILDTSPGTINRELNNLVDAEILLTEFSKNRRWFRVNKECFIYAELKDIIVKTFGVIDILKNKLEPYKNKINSAFVFGSTAQGSEKGESDIDILVITDELTIADLALIFKPLENIFQRELNFVVFPTSLLINDKFKNHHFLSSVFKKTIIPIIVSKDNPSIQEILSQVNLKIKSNI